MLTIKILGAGCANCKRVEQLVRKAVDTLALEADLIKITDYGEIATYDILSTPGLVINGEVVSSGRIPGMPEITTWLVNAVEKETP